MRHVKDGRKLSRTWAHRRALLRNLTTALFAYERIETTVEKAKEARRMAERMITYAKRGNLHSRRLVAQTVNDPMVVRKLFDTIAPWYAQRPGGYTRILRTRARLGDGGEMAILELVKTPEQKEEARRAREKDQKAAEQKAHAKAAKIEKAEAARAEKAEKTEKGEKAAVEKAEKPKTPRGGDKAGRGGKGSEKGGGLFRRRATGRSGKGE